MANEMVVEFDSIGLIMVKFKNRISVCNTYVLNGNEELLLNTLPMEEMDVLIHPSRQELIVNPEHPHYVVLKLKRGSV